MVRPALASALRVAGIGPVSMMVGSAPESAVATMRAARRQAELAALGLAADQHRRGAVDDARGVAGGVHVVDALDLRVAGSATASKPIAPSSAKATLSEPRPSSVVRGLMNSSRSSSGQADLVVDRQHRAVEVARRLRRRGALLRRQGDSGRRRRGPSRRAWRSGRRRCPAARSRWRCWCPGPAPRRRRRSRSAPATCSRRRRPRPGLPSRSRTFCAAMFTASRPEAQKRLICTPATCTSQPALSAAVLAITEPCSPTGETTPITTSSSAAGSKSWRFCSFDQQAGQQIDRLDLVQAAVLLALAARRANGVENHRVRHGRLPH